MLHVECETCMLKFIETFNKLMKCQDEHSLPDYVQHFIFISNKNET